MPAYRDYLKRWLLCFGGLFLASGLLILVVDPYGFYRLVERDGFNRNKPFTPNIERVHKSFQVERLQPDTLVMGSSRVLVGIDPDGSCWPESLGRVYNLGIGGADIREIAALLPQAAAAAPVKTVVLGLDFFSFNASLFQRDLQDDYRFGAGPLERYRYLFSLSALADAFDTLRKQDETTAPGLLETGQMSWHYRDKRIRKYGHLDLFRRTELTSIETAFLPAPADAYAFQVAGRPSSFAYYQSILEFCRERGIRLRVYLSPVHVRMLELISRLGLWADYLTWQREVVTRYEQTFQGDAEAVVWDFSGVNSITVEPVRERPGDAMMHYWESGHFKTGVGDLIVCRIFGGRGPDGFGRPLQRASLDTYQQTYTAEFDAYRRHAPEVVADVAEVARTSRFGASLVKP